MTSCHDGLVDSTVTSQQEDPGVNLQLGSQSRVFLCQVCMFSSCLCKFFSGSPVSSHNPNSGMLGCFQAKASLAKKLCDLNGIYLVNYHTLTLMPLCSPSFYTRSGFNAFLMINHHGLATNILFMLRAIVKLSHVMGGPRCS